MKAAVLLLIGAASLAVPAVSRADGKITGVITSVAAEAYPDQGVMFSMSTGVTGCPAGSWLSFGYPGSGVGGDTLKAVYAFVLASYFSGQTVNVWWSSSAPAQSGACGVTAVRGALW